MRKEFTRNSSEMTEVKDTPAGNGDMDVKQGGC